MHLQKLDTFGGAFQCYSPGNMLYMYSFLNFNTEKVIKKE